jgi:hypothetical protein
MTSLSRRKSWDIFALSIENIDFKNFCYNEIDGGPKKDSRSRGDVRSIRD